jgi:ribonucleotide monophosphatase NagD (HAD superfamily)
MTARCGVLPRHRVAAIGDGIHTDIAGAAAQHIDAVFIASAVHIPGAKTGKLTTDTLIQAFAYQKKRPAAALQRLAW